MPLLVALGLWIACAPPSEPDSPDPPVEPSGPTRHAVLICMDTVRYDAWDLVLRYAPPPPDSPWNRAIRLTRAQSTAPWTLPSIASVLTGLYPNAHGAGAFPERIANFREQSAALLDDEAVTLAERLWQAGLATTSLTASKMFQWANFRQGFERQRFMGGVDSRLRIAEGAENWLNRHARETPEGRFFLYLHFMDAHRRNGRYGLAARMARVPPALDEAARAAAPAHACAAPGPDCDAWIHYVAAVLLIRDTITDLLELFEKRGLLDETSIALFSDHGEEFLDHRDLSQSRAIIPRFKYGTGHGHTLFQEQLHVPVVFWHPDLPGRELDAPATLADLAPTLLGWLGVDAPPGDGIDLGPVLAGADFDAERPLFSSAASYGPRREAVLQGNRKRVSGGGDASDLSFDIDRDPREERPSDRGDGDLDALLAAYRRGREEPRSPGPIDAKMLRELQALGYLEDAEPTADARVQE